VSRSLGAQTFLRAIEMPVRVFFMLPSAEAPTPGRGRCRHQDALTTESDMPLERGGTSGFVISKIVGGGLASRRPPPSA